MISSESKAASSAWRFVRREDAHRLERGAHLRCQRTDVDLGGFHCRVLGGTRGRAAPGRKTLSYDDRFSGSVPGAYLPRINRGGRRWTLASGATGTAGESIRILGIDPGSQATGFGIIDWQDGDARYVASGAIRTRGEAFPAPVAPDLRRRAGTRPAVRPAGSRDRARVHAPQCRQRAQAGAGAGRGHLRRILR